MIIKKGDTIKIIKGKDAGKTGVVMRVLVKNSKIIVDGCHMFKKHVRPKKQGQKGELVLVPRPFASSNAALLCARCKKGVRVHIRYEGQKKIRVCTQCQSDFA